MIIHTFTKKWKWSYGRYAHPGVRVWQNLRKKGRVWRKGLHLVKNSSPGSKADFSEKFSFGIWRLILSRFDIKWCIYDIILFEGVCSELTSSWPPARVKWGWELRLLRHFAPIMRWVRWVLWVPRGHFLCAGALLESHLLGIGRPFWTQSHPKLPLGAQGAPNGPTESQGSQRGTKVTPRRAPWEPKAPQRLPKGSPKSPQGEQNEKMTSKDN